MADAMVEIRPAVRFYCYRCNIEFEDVLQDYTCPYCASGFIEQLENRAGRMSIRQMIRQARLRPGNEFANRGNEATLESLLQNEPNMRDQIPPVLRDIAFLMSGGRLREAGGRPRQGAAGAPLVLVGAPGDYVFGGEALDAVVTQLLGQLEHSGPPPMPRDVLNSIPSEAVTEQQAGTSCSVCWDNFQLGETVSRLECEHIFHSICITPWLQLHATCPICRRSLLPQTPQVPREQEDSQSTGSSTSTPTTASPTTTTTTTNGARPRPTLTPRVVIRRSTHPLFRRAFQTLTWDSPRDMSTSSNSWSTSVTTGGRWAPQSRTDSSSNSNTSHDDRMQNYHTDFDCD